MKIDYNSQVPVPRIAATKTSEVVRIGTKNTTGMDQVCRSFRGHHATSSSVGSTPCRERKSPTVHEGSTRPRHRPSLARSRARAFHPMQAYFTCSADTFAAIPSRLLPSLATSAPAAHHDIVLQQRPQRPSRTPCGMSLQVRVQHRAGHGPGERAELVLQRDSHPRVPASSSTTRERQSLFPFTIPVTVRQ